MCQALTSNIHLSSFFPSYDMSPWFRIHLPSLFIKNLTLESTSWLQVALSPRNNFPKLGPQFSWTGSSWGAELCLIHLCSPNVHRDVGHLRNVRVSELN